MHAGRRRGPMVEDPCKVFRELGRTTWTALGTCHSNRIILGEDAITTLLLVNIATRLNGRVIYSDTRPFESSSGCDFELLIGAARSGWWRYAVQAKRVGIPNGRYASLNHKVGGSGKDQKDILEAYAKGVRAKPLYALYNYLVPPPGLYDHLFGITIAPLSVVRRATSTRGGQCFNWIHRQPGVHPWFCLVCPGCWPPAGKGPSERRGWEGIEAFHTKEVPRDIASWLQLGVVPHRSVEADTPLSPGDCLRPKAVAIVDVGEVQASAKP